MKFVKAVTLAIGLVSGTAIAAGMEELCHKAAEQNVIIKSRLNADPEYLQKYLTLIANEKVKQSLKDSIREEIFNTTNNSDKKSPTKLRVLVKKKKAK